MRHETQERTAIRYIEDNLVKAHLCAVPGDWPFSSARFRDEFNRLIVAPRGDAVTPTSSMGQGKR